MSCPPTGTRPLGADDAAEAQPADVGDDRSADMAARPTYVIFFSPRSGSTWLTKLLSGTDLLGYPEEYLNPEFVAEVAQAMNCADLADLLAVLQRHRSSPNGVFGIEVLAHHVALFGEEQFFLSFYLETQYFLLWRRNIVAQGISLFRAVATRRFHSWEVEQHPARYDANDIRNWIDHIVAIENDNVLMLRKRHRRPNILCYEEMIADPAGVRGRIAASVGVAVDGAREGPLPSKIADDWNHACETRFRAESADFVAGLQDRRLMLNRSGDTDLLDTQNQPG